MRSGLTLIVFILLCFSSCRGDLILNSGKTLYGSVTTPPCTLIYGATQYFAYAGANIYEGSSQFIHLFFSSYRIIIIIMR